MKRSKLVLGGLAMLLLIGAAVGARPAYRQVKTWRAHALVREAEQLWANRQIEEAVARGQSALQLSPHDATAIRFMANLLVELRHPQAVALLERVLEAPGASATDRLRLISFGLLVRRFDVVERQLEVALRQPAAEPSAELLGLAARYEQLRGRRGEAVRFARRALELAPQNRAAQLQLAQLQGLSPWPEEVLESQQRLWALARGEDDAGIESLALLAGRSDLGVAELEQLRSLLKAHPVSAGRRALLTADVELRLAPGRRAAIIDAVVATHAAAAAAERMELGRWLNRHGEFRRTLVLLEATAAAASREMLLVRWDALAGAAQWAALRQELAQPGLPLEPALAALFQARVASELGETRVAELYWDQALSQAARDPAQLWYIADYAQRCRLPAVAMRAYRRLIAEGAAARPAYAALVRLVEAGRDTRALRDLIREMASRFPDDLEPRNDLAYLDLLLGENVTQAAATAAQLAAEHPALPAVRTTQALALLRKGQPAAAARVYQEMPLPWEQALPAWQAVYVAAHAAAGQQAQARALAQSLKSNLLKPEERALIDSLLAPE